MPAVAGLAPVSNARSRGRAPRCAIAVLLLLVSLLAVGAQDPVKPAGPERARIALVIGNSKYTKFEALPNAANDAEDVAAALKSFGFRVTVAIDFNRAEMRRVIRSFADGMLNSATALFYYAGHGAQVNGVNYLLPTDAEVQDVRDLIEEGVAANEILGRMGLSGAATKVMVLDACRNLPIAQKRPLGDALASKDGLAAMEAPVGAFVAFATAPGGVAADGNERNGVFTKHFLESLRGNDTSIEAVFKRTRAAVVAATKGKQIPWDASSLVEEFAFGRANTAPRAEGSALAAAAALSPSSDASAPTAAEATMLEVVRQVLALRRDGKANEEAQLLEQEAKRIEHLDLLRNLASAYRRAKNFARLAGVSERIISMHPSDLTALEDFEFALRQLGRHDRARPVQEFASFLRTWNGGRLYRPFVLVSSFGLLPGVDARFVGHYDFDLDKQRLRIAFQDIDVRIRRSFLERYRIEGSDLRVFAGPADAQDGRTLSRCELALRYDAATQSIVFRQQDPKARVVCEFALDPAWTLRDLELMTSVHVVRDRATELARAMSGVLIP